MSWPKEVIDQKHKETNFRCEECGEKLSLTEFDKRPILHHIINRCQDGLNIIENARLRCPDCEEYYHKHFPYGNVTNSSYYFFAVKAHRETK